VHDRWDVPVQVIERFGHLAEVVDHLFEWQPRITFVLQDLLEVGTVDPVHDDDVAGPVLGEEVAADHRQRGVRGDRHQQSRLRQQRVSVLPTDRVDLQCDQPVVQVVDRLEHRRPSPVAHLAQHLVAPAEQLGVRHGGRSLRRDRAGRRA
jgi:hypothetical protein